MTHEAEYPAHPLRRDTDTFVSYSHVDAELIAPVVKMMRMYRRRVFTDAEIPAGVRWRDAIREAIEASASVAIFWCCHSAGSKEVAAELDIAIAASKPLAPFLLCGQHVPSPLDEYQWIDFANTVSHSCVVHAAGEIEAAPYEDFDPAWEQALRRNRLPAQGGGAKFGTGLSGGDWRQWKPGFVHILDLAEDGSLQTKISESRGRQRGPAGTDLEQE